MELVTGATGYVGSRLAAPPCGGGAARARAGANARAGGAARGRGGARRRPAHRRGSRERARGHATTPTTSCTRWRPRATSDFAGARPARGRGLRGGGGERRRRAGGLPRRDRPGRARLRRTCARGSRWRRSCSTPCRGSTALRASIVIGAGSSSFRVLVRLVERLRVLPMPALALQPHPADRRARHDRVSRPHPASPAAAGRSLDVCGPDVMTYGEMIERIAESMGVGRMPVGLGARSRRRRARSWRP